MLFVISMALALLLVCFGDKALKKHPVPFYIAGAVVTVAVIAVSQTDALRTMPEIVRDYIIAVFSKGSFAAALWCVVMWAGAFPNGSAPIKKLMPIRGELSIFASAITLSHIITYGIQYIKTLSNNIKLNRDPATEFILTCIIAVVLILIMLPLAVMSFKAVRKKMNPKTWKKIQRSAYVFYALIYTHIMVLYVPQARRGMTDKYISIILYSIVFIGYALMRIRKAYIKKNPEKATSSYVVCGISAVILVGLSAVLSYGKAPERKIPDTVAPAISTTAQADTATTAVSDETADESTTTAVSTSGTQSTSSGETETSTTGTGTETTTTGTETTESTDDEENGDNPEESETTPVEEENEPEQNEEPQPEPEPEPEPEPQYMYNNGTYSGTAYGYAGDITVTITIENDVITDIQAVAEANGDDPDYYEPAMYYVLPQIQQSMSADVDAYSGATYSSLGIMDAARNALSQAVR
ncbi:MAG: FMN-binding protein [Ruminococcus flavefaciens]|nr:FMN-binding protein [Ruminococcus flavefaciens]MCM1230835.1 FMN-binding protein [Ruminococcus flavefaciens]